ncbi:MAG TPA: hypothetical protein VMQ54_00870 [Steroidobacteraceae bacterium]|nr:hypothetical protein [Steroidobacteraceae bacterium]
MSTYVRVAGAWGAVLVLAACAQTSSGVKPQASAAATPDPTCLTQTGSRLGDGTNCTAAGHSYSKDDMDRTGATTVGGALRLLDPSLTISH